MAQQLSLFAEVFETKKIDKPIRLIELFAGIGAQAKALEILGVKFEHYKTCEWAFNSILAYNAIHLKDETDYSNGKSKEELIAYLNGNISVDYNKPADLTKKPLEWLKKCYNSCIANHNLMNIMKVRGEDLEIVEKDKYEYILTYSFPCQDLSLAGKRQGMSVSQAEGGTRSGLLWEVERILNECSKTNSLPQILVMENVPQVIQSGAIKDFQKWRKALEDLGYENYCEILNAKEYGIPQNRNRCFMVSILGEWFYEFPHTLPLKYKLKDFLEKDVDEKYYISEKDIERIQSWNAQQKPLENAIDAENDTDIVMGALTARGAGEEHSGMKLIKETIKVGNYGNGHHAKDVYDPSGCMPTITTGNHGLGQTIAIKTANSKGYELAENGDGVDVSSRMESHRGTVQKGVAHTIDTKNSAGGGYRR